MSQKTSTTPNSGTPEYTGPVHNVLVKRDVAIEMPALYLDIHVIPPWEGDTSEERAFAKMFARSYCRKAVSIDSADLVIFTGGEDVNPALYGADRHPATFMNSDRDAREQELFEHCVLNGIPMLGICRGAQFLHVMHGGKLWQDVDHHNGDHSIWDIRERRPIPRVSSVHHQMVMRQPELGMEVLADSDVARKRWADGSPSNCEHGTRNDVEAYFYRDTCTIGIQGHPEYHGYHQFMQWSLKKIDELVITNPDVEYVGGSRRIKADIRKEVAMKRAEKKLKELV